jgi:predicted Fe-Mo cluster-binding NifX family protein
MIIALPLTEDDAFSAHFGSSVRAALFEVDLASRTITCSGVFTPPDLAPCGWAPWLRDLGVNRLLASGMGRGAQVRMAECGIEVVTGVEPGELELVIQSWLEGTLAVGANTCAGGDHPGHGCHHQHHHDHGHHPHVHAGDDDHGHHDHHGRCGSSG